MSNNWESGIKYLGGDEASEAKVIDTLVDLVNVHIEKIRHHTGRPANRPQHAKSLVATSSVNFNVLENIPNELKVGFLATKCSYPCYVRFSNASGLMFADNEKDLRGCAVRVKIGEDKFHDLLMTNAEEHHAKDAVEAMWTSFLLYKPGILNKLAGFAKLTAKFGPITASRILKTLLGQIKIPVESLATETYWSRAAYKFGSVAVRFRLNPEQQKSEVIVQTSNNLADEFANKVSTQDIIFNFEVQIYVDEHKTPIEDSTKSWGKNDAPFISIGTLVINQRADLTQFGLIDAMKFNPWNVSDSSIFEPLGNMNRARKHVYIASAKARI